MSNHDHAQSATHSPCHNHTQAIASPHKAWKLIRRTRDALGYSSPHPDPLAVPHGRMGSVALYGASCDLLSQLQERASTFSRFYFEVVALQWVPLAGDGLAGEFEWVVGVAADDSDDMHWHVPGSTPTRYCVATQH